MTAAWWIAAALSVARAGASPEACALCHRAETRAFSDAGMTRALESGKGSAILRANPKLTAKIGEYSYEIARAGDESIMTVTDSHETVRVPLAWAFGLGAAGQTYLFEREGRWYESRVSYFSALHGLDLTLGQAEPHNLTEAVGRMASPVEVAQCFDCHATNVVRSPRLDLSGVEPGVQCERCHGGAEAHLQKKTPMRKLGAFATEQMSDFCGQCHRTWSEIAANGPRGIANVRFQPYRLGNSKCYDAEDNRIRCTACHNPHRAVETSAGAYDSKCVACHRTTLEAAARICRVAAKNCVTCHMPRLDLPGAHQKFTDHMIRIVKAGEPYPG